MKPLVVIIDDCPIQRDISRRELGKVGIAIPDTPSDVTAVEIGRVVLVVTDRFMSPDWDDARDVLLTMLPNVKVVEWTSSAGLLGITDEHKLPRSSATYTKSGDGKELKKLIHESLVAGVARSNSAPYFDPTKSLNEVLK